MVQGYGMTETCCVISMTSHGDAMGGHVGGPVVCCEIKLVDIPEMNYTHTDKPHPRGEVGCCSRMAVRPMQQSVQTLFESMSSTCTRSTRQQGSRPL